MDLRPKGVPWDRQLWERIQRKGGAHYRAPCSDYIDVERKIEARELRYADRVEVYVAGQKFMESVVVLNGGVYMSTGIKAPDEPITVRQGEHDAPTEQDRYDSVSVTGSGRQVDEDATDINPNRPRVVECVAWDPEAAGDNWREPSPHIADVEDRIAAGTVQDGDLVFIEETMECVNVLLDRKYMIRPVMASSNYPPSAVPEPPPKRRIVEGERVSYPALSEADEAMRVSLGMTREQWEDWNHGGGWSAPRRTPDEVILGALVNPKQLRQTAIYFATRAAYHRKIANTWLAVAIGCVVLTVGVLFIPSGWIYMLFEAFQ